MNKLTPEIINELALMQGRVREIYRMNIGVVEFTRDYVQLLEKTFRETFSDDDMFVMYSKHQSYDELRAFVGDAMFIAMSRKDNKEV